MNAQRPQMVVKILAGKVVVLDIFPGDTIQTVKERISTREAIPVVDQRIICNGKELDDAVLVSDEPRLTRDTIHCVTRRKQEEKN